MKLINFLLALLFLTVTACKSQGNLESFTADKKATASTVKLLSNMKTLAAKGIMIGHQDDLAYGIGWISPNGKSDVYRVCSDYPAVFGWDLGHIEKGSAVNLDSVPFSDMARYATEMNANGGINTFSWHPDNPLTGGSAWDISKPGVVKSILPGGSKNAEFNLWLNRAATFLKSLKDADGEAVPVLFRPFHEQTGSWFWWGKNHCTAEEFRQLWIYTFKYLTETQNTHNLIFVFSTGGDFKNVDEFTDRYPGDDFVDIVGFDTYLGTNQSGSDYSKTLSDRLNTLFEFANARNKPAAITEIGFEQIPDPHWWTEVFYPAVKDKQASYALFWRNAANKPNHYYMPYPGQKSEKDFMEFYNLPGTLFLKDIENKQLYK